MELAIPNCVVLSKSSNADKQGTGDEQRGDDAFLHGNSILLIVWGTWAGDCPFQRADGIVPKGS